MGKQYEQLKPEERATVMLMRRQGSSMRAVARALRRILDFGRSCPVVAVFRAVEEDLLTAGRSP